MKQLLDPEEVKTAATSAAGDVAGTAADPKTGWARLKSRLASPTVLAIAAGVAACFFAGRRSAHR